MTMAIPANIPKIQHNLQNIIDLNRDAYAPAHDEIGIVYGYLKSEDNHDNGLGLFGNLLFSAFSLIGSIEGLPGAPIIAWFLSGVVQSYATPPTPPNLLDPTITKIAERHLATYIQLDTDLTYLYNHVEENLDKVYTLPPLFSPKTTITLRELENYDVPGKYDDLYVRLKEAYIAGFRNELVKQELPRVGGYAIGTVQRRIQLRYWLYIMHAPGEAGDITHTWDSGNLHIDNSELQRGQHISLDGAAVADFSAIMGEFCDQVGCAYVIPTASDADSREYHKYYMVTGFSDGSMSGWDIPTTDFTNWLFKDDGFGKVVRPDSVALRTDVFRNWGIMNSDKLPLACNHISHTPTHHWFVRKLYKAVNKLFKISVISYPVAHRPAGA